MFSYLGRTLRTAFFYSFGLISLYLLICYQYPRFAPIADLKDGSVMLGYPTPASQLLWLHCSEECQKQNFNNGKEWTHMIAVEYLNRASSTGASSRCSLDSSSSSCLVKVHSPRTITVTIADLQPCTTYTYTIDGFPELDSHENAPKLRRGTFQTPPTHDSNGCELVSSSSSHVSESAFVFGSCLGISPFRSMHVFRWLLDRASRVDFALLLGDTVYVDIPKLDDYVAYKQIWNDEPFRNLFARIPFLGTYDDHEIINDWSIGDVPDKFETSMAMFDEFVASKNPPPPTLPTMEPSLTTTDVETTSSSSTPPSASSSSPTRRYFSYQHSKHVSVFVVDAREYASPLLRGSNATVSNESSPSRTKLGSVQKAALFKWLLETRATFKFISSSVAWTLAAFKFVQDGWAAYRHERNEIFDFIVQHNITGVMLLSADLHWTGVFHLKRWNLYEFTVSPIASFPLPHWILNIDDEPRVFASQMGKHIGEVRVHAPNDNENGVADDGDGGVVEPYLNTTIWKYMYGTPQLAFTRVWKVEDLIPKNVIQNEEKA